MAKNIQLKNSIKWKLLFTMLGLIIGLLTILTLVQIYSQKEILTGELVRRIELIKDNLRKQGKTLSDNLAFQVEDALASYNLLDIFNRANKAVQENDDLKYIILADLKGIALVHTLKPELNETVLSDDDDRFAIARFCCLISPIFKTNFALSLSKFTILSSIMSISFLKSSIFMYILTKIIAFLFNG